MSWSFELIDLSRLLTEETAVALFGNIGSPVFNKVDVEYVVNWPEKNGRITKFSVLDHFGTHVDAPIHTVPDGADLAGVDIGRLIGEAVVPDMYKGASTTAIRPRTSRPRPSTFAPATSC